MKFGDNPDVSQEDIASIFRTEHNPSKKLLNVRSERKSNYSFLLPQHPLPRNALSPNFIALQPRKPLCPVWIAFHCGQFLNIEVVEG
jgi:hypothetical protein